MPMAAARGAGVTYRKTEQTEPHGGGGQGVIAFAAVLVAGLLFAGGAAAIFLGAPPPSATPTRAGVVEPTLPPFVQPTATPGPETPAPIVSGTPPSSPGTSPGDSPGSSPETPGASPTLDPSDPSPTDPIVTPTTTPTRRPTATPTQRPTATPTQRPTATPTDRPTATPTATPTQPPQASCDNATGQTQTVFLGFGNAESRGPIDRAWCIQRVIIRPYLEFGRTRLLRDGARVAAYTCSPGTCQNASTRNFSPPERIPAGSTLVYEFTCADNPETSDVNECSDANQGGATIEIQYRVLDGS